MSNISNRSDCHCPQFRLEQRRRVAALCHLDDPLREQLAARSLETIHFGPEYCGRALSRGEWGDGNERTGDEASSRRERSETADGRCNPGHGKCSGSGREDSPQGRGRHNRDGIHDFVALERRASPCFAVRASTPQGSVGSLVRAAPPMLPSMNVGWPPRTMSDEGRTPARWLIGPLDLCRRTWWPEGCLETWRDQMPPD